MSIETVHTALTAIIGVAVGAKITYGGTPNIKPATLPVVSTDWTGTTQVQAIEQTHPKRVNGKMVKQGIRRIETYTTFVLLSTSGSIPDVETAQVAVADLIIDALDADMTLMGTGAVDVCARCDIVSIKPYDADWDATVYHGIQIDTSAIEL